MQICIEMKNIFKFISRSK